MDAIKGIGVDIVEIERLGRALEEHPRLKERLFTPAERIYCASRPAAEIAHLAGRFVAKEAVAKAIGRSLSWQAVQIENGPAGQPRVTLDGPARDAAGDARILVSISHSRHYAVAYAMLIGTPTTPEFGIGDSEFGLDHSRASNSEIRDPLEKITTKTPRHQERHFPL